MKRVSIMMSLVPCLLFLAGCAHERDFAGMGGTPFTTSVGAGAGSFNAGFESGGQSSSGLDQRDTVFLNTAAQLGRADIALAELASERGFAQPMRDYAQYVLRDYVRSNRELTDLAAGKSEPIQITTDSKQQKTLARLSQLQGPEFDRAFQREAIRSQEEQVGIYKRAADGCKDPDVQDFARRILSIHEAHLVLAKSLPLDSSTTTTLSWPGAPQHPELK